MLGPGLRILTLGSGDASMQVSIARVHPNMVVTFYDHESEVLEKYPEASDNLLALREAGVEVCFGIDACKLDSYSDLGLFDVVMFYFPHTGDSVESNKSLIRGFLSSVGNVVRPGGEVHLAVKSSNPYKKWGVSEIIDASDLAVSSKFQVDRDLFPEYIHRTTKGTHANYGRLPMIKGAQAVKDDDAIVYTLEPKSNLASNSAIRDLHSRGVNFRAHVWHMARIEDDAILDVVLDIVTASSLQTESQIRSELNQRLDLEIEVESKQVNRVLMVLVGSGHLMKQFSVDASSSKPTYSAASHDISMIANAGGSLDEREAKRLREDDLKLQRAQVLEVLEIRKREGGGPMGTLELAHSIGLSRQKDVKGVLYSLRDARLVDEVLSESVSSRASRWCLAN